MQIRILNDKYSQTGGAQQDGIMMIKDPSAFDWHDNEYTDYNNMHHPISEQIYNRPIGKIYDVNKQIIMQNALQHNRGLLHKNANASTKENIYAFDKKNFDIKYYPINFEKINDHDKDILLNFAIEIEHYKHCDMRLLPKPNKYTYTREHVHYNFYKNTNTIRNFDKTIKKYIPCYKVTCKHCNKSEVFDTNIYI